MIDTIWSKKKYEPSNLGGKLENPNRSMITEENVTVAEDLFPGKGVDPGVFHWTFKIR